MSMKISMGMLPCRIKENTMSELFLPCIEGSTALFVIESKEAFHCQQEQIHRLSWEKRIMRCA
jgi:hypothetical protein